MRGGLARTAAAVLAYGLAMACVEAAAVIYLRRAYGLATGDIFPLHDPGGADPLATIELAREAATLVMLVAVGWLAGRSGLDRLAWTAVAFGGWDIGYYAWLAIFSGWPPSLATWDLLFLIPVPWAGPVWAPVVVSVALIGFGLAAAARLRVGHHVRVRPWQAGGALLGGILVIASFTIDAGQILAGGRPESFAWPLFAAGMLAAATTAGSALTAAGSARASSPDSGHEPLPH